MQRFFGRTIDRAVVGLVLTLAGTAGQAAEAVPVQPPIEAFFQAPSFSAASLSPDGRLLAFRIGAKGGRERLAVLDLASMKPTVVADFKDADVGRFQWVNDRRLVFDLVIELEGPGTSTRGSGLFAVDHDGEGFRQLVETQFGFFKDPLADSKRLPWNTYLLSGQGMRDGDDVFVVSPQEISQKKMDFIKLQRLNTVTGRATDVDAPLHSFDWILDTGGALRVAVTRQGHTEAIRVRDAAGQWRKLAEFDRLSAQRISPRFFSADGRLYVEARSDTDKTAIYTLDLESGKLASRPVVAAKDFDVHAGFVTNQKKLLGLRFAVDAEITHWLDADMKAMQATVDALLPNTANRISVPQRATTPYALVEAFADVQPTLSYLYDTQTRKLVRLGSSQPEIDPRQMGLMDMLRYKARDGLEIPAYLTLPPGGARKNLPMVVLVHGGPWVRGASWRWNPEVQFLATRGYAVLQPEFRGSTGFGARHFQAGFRQWGRAMQDDVADGVRWAIKEGIADAKRICIAGAGYGGFAALMGLVKDSDLFRCGIDWVGVTDIDLMYSIDWSDASDEFKQYDMRQMIGDPIEDAALLKSSSPLANAGRIAQPLLMAYGGADVRVPLVHGEKMRDALKAHNAQVEWVVYPDEGHGWNKVETKVDFWGRVERFLERHIGQP